MCKLWRHRKAQQHGFIRTQIPGRQTKIARNTNVMQHCTSPREIAHSKVCLKQEFQWYTKTLMLRLASHIHVARSLCAVKCSCNTTRNCMLIKYTKCHIISCYFLSYASSSIALNLWFTDRKMSGGFPICVTASSTNNTMARVSVTIYTWKPHNSLQFLKVQSRTQRQYIP
jgi:hypothetical protein